MGCASTVWGRCVEEAMASASRDDSPKLTILDVVVIRVTPDTSQDTDSCAQGKWYKKYRYIMWVSFKLQNRQESVTLEAQIVRLPYEELHLTDCLMTYLWYHARDLLANLQ